MQILAMIFIGLFVGILAKILMPGKDPGGFLVTSLLGIAGSIAAGLAGRQIGLYKGGESAGILASVIGAMALLAVYRFLKNRKSYG